MNTDGIINLNKPSGISSHTAVMRIRRRAAVKVGHTGTLDPAASGVLILCLGKATRLAQFFVDDEKEYLATLRLGVATTTDDAEGEVVKENDTSHLNASEVAAALNSFVGEGSQIPPHYSAVHHQGKRLYQLARQGKFVEVAARPVTISALKVLGWALPYVTFSVSCSKGTYIRSLCRDIGNRLGVGAHLSALMRTRVGKFSLRTATPLSAFGSREAVWENLLPMADCLTDFPALVVPDDAIMSLTCGQSLNVDRFSEQIDPLKTDQLYRMLDHKGQFLALSKACEEQGKIILKPKRVFL